MPDEEEERHLTWSDQLEILIAQEGEKARGLAWLHQQAETKATQKNNWIQSPVIVLSTLAGTASVGSSSLFSGSENISSIVIGLVSISVGILNTLAGYFSFSRKAEGHHIAYISYSKLFTRINVELNLPRHERQEPQEILKGLRTEMERLAEIVPTPPPDIIREFNRKFKDYKDVTKPSEVNGLQKINIYRVAIRVPNGTADRSDAIREQAQRPTSGETQSRSPTSTSDVLYSRVSGGGQDVLPV